MDARKVRIVFMGSPEFAVYSLSSLVENGFNIAGVITSPDKPAGRGLKIRQSEVKKYADTKNLKTLQPENLKDPGFIQTLTELDPELQIIVGFRKLPKEVWSIPKYGTFNLHASLLPQYRGAAPINRAIMNGETISGVTTFFINEEIDTGKIIDQVKVRIGENDNAGILHDKLAESGAKLVIKTTQKIVEGNFEEIDQEKLVMEISSDLKKAPKIFKEDCRIPWNKDPKTVYNFIRGLSPYPTAWTTISLPGGNKFILKVFASFIDIIDHKTDTGTILSDQKTYLKIAVPGGYIKITELQLEGKKRMGIADFLRGNQVEGWKVE